MWRDGDGEKRKVTALRLCRGIVTSCHYWTITRMRPIGPHSWGSGALLGICLWGLAGGFRRHVGARGCFL
jgi:hypothetical protein